MLVGVYDMSSFGSPARCYGKTYIASGGNTELIDADTWYQIDGAAYSSTICYYFHQTDASSAMQYRRLSPRRVYLRATISASSNKADNFHFGFARNGAVISDSCIDRQINALGEKASVSIIWTLCLYNNDIVSIVVKSTVQNNATLTTDHGVFVATSI